MPVWMIVVEWVARGILVMLVLLSVWSVQIMLNRRSFFKRIFTGFSSGDDDAFLSQAQDEKSSLWGRAAQAVSNHKDSIASDRAFEVFLEKEQGDIEKGIPILGTLGSTAPFIGLLGTVLGIIKAFGDLALNAQNTNKVMFLLAEALILTAVGLAVAIPAVVAYNHFSRKKNALYRKLQSLKYLVQNKS